jgi:hypothetical protein
LIDMLTIRGNRQGGFCDGLSRRSFLHVGGLAMGGLTLPGLLRAESLVPLPERKHKALIMIYLPGGPPHQDMWDIKADAPSGVRGEFEAISTNVPGIEVCEMFPRLATMADRCAFVRSVVGCQPEHDAFQCMTGRTKRPAPAGGWPSVGSTVSKLLGPVDLAVPPFVGLSPKMGHMPWADAGKPGFLGPAYSPFQPMGEAAGDMVLKGITLDRLRDRRSLLTSFDTFRRAADTSGIMEGLDAFQAQAMGVLTSSWLAEALDVTKEDVGLRDRYGRGTPKCRDDGGPELLDQFLVARRLVEAGARVVTLAFSRWDWHGKNFQQAREVMPMLDQGLTALLEDLKNRGMEKDVSIVVWGEFGRTPRINGDGGRDHWPAVSCALLAGGGLRTGQVIGSTDRDGGQAKDRPVHMQEILATLYRTLGIDPHGMTIPDLGGRPQHLVDPGYDPMRELI